MKELLADTAARATRYLTHIGSRRVAPLARDVKRLDARRTASRTSK